jgi:hypothetical protein
MTVKSGEWRLSERYVSTTERQQVQSGLRVKYTDLDHGVNRYAKSKHTSFTLSLPYMNSIYKYSANVIYLVEWAALPSNRYAELLKALSGWKAN